jgi:hypothetical protein
MRWARHVTHMGKECIQGFGRTEGKRQVGGPRYRWDDTIIMDLREIGLWEGGMN